MPDTIGMVSTDEDDDMSLDAFRGRLARVGPLVGVGFVGLKKRDVCSERQRQVGDIKSSRAQRSHL